MCFDVFLCLDFTWGLHWGLNSLLSVENSPMCKNVHFSQSFHCWRKNGCLAEALLTRLVFSSPFSQQHPCLSMNSVRRRVNLGHCCLPGKRVFSMCDNVQRLIGTAFNSKWFLKKSCKKENRARISLNTNLTFCFVNLVSISRSSMALSSRTLYGIARERERASYRGRDVPEIALVGEILRGTQPMPSN